jgi:hypothetical protein
MTETTQKKPEEAPKKSEETVVLDGPAKAPKIIAVDCGTMNIVLAKQKGKAAELSTIRNMFLPLDKSQVTMAELSNLDYVESDDQIFIIGEDAFSFSNIFGQAVKRPMSKGLISPQEVDSLDVLTLILKKLVGTTTNGRCIYSIPAPSIDIQNNITYHEGVFHRIFTELGYVAESFNEAMAIIYSQCQNEQFTGLAFSFGAGMVNVCLSYKSVPVVTFSVARSGDWIDEQTAMSLGTIPNRITAIKEKSTDLTNYKIGSKKERRIREAIIYYYREVIRYSLDQVVKKLEASTDNLELPESLSVVVSGGTSMATGFLPLFNDVLREYQDKFPINIKEVRQADDPMTSVAEGLLIRAMTKYPS